MTRKLLVLLCTLTVCTTLLFVATASAQFYDAGQAGPFNLRFNSRTPESVQPNLDPATFLPTAVYHTAGQLGWYAAVADMNGDGKPDLLAVSYSSVKNGNCKVAVLLGNGDGTFQTPQVFDTGGLYSVSFVVGDLNGDGKPDVVVASMSCGSCGSSQSGVRVLIGTGNGRLRLGGIYSTGGFPFSSGQGSSIPMAIADLNGDGKPDLVVINQTTSTYGDGVAGVLIGNGDGTFKPVVSYDTGAFGAGSFAIGDLNNDGKLDLAIANCAPKGTTACPGNNGKISVLRGRGDGTFRPASVYRRGGGALFSGPVVIADVNSDGRPDLLVGNYCLLKLGDCVGNGSVGVLLARSDGSFMPPVTYDSGGFDASSIVIADVSGDGKPDLVVSNGAVGVLIGNGNGTFQPGVSYATGGNTGAVLVTDLNHDNIPDIVATNGTSDTAAVLLGQGSGTFTAPTLLPLGGVAYASPVVAADLNGDTFVDLVSANWCIKQSVCHVSGSEAGTLGVVLNNSASH